MKKSTRRWLWGVLAACLLVGAAGAGVGYYLFFAPPNLSIGNEVPVYRPYRYARVYI